LPPQSPTTQKSAAETAGIPPARTSAQGEGRAQPPTPAQAVKLASDAQHSAPQADGSQELSLAERYLEGTNGPRDTTTAARWLWKAVSKQNTRADMLLADLYARGDGVAKSCDQARLLLTAASEKGDSQAAQRLRNLESGGCR
jgi:TPR repeat protein